MILKMKAVIFSLWIAGMLTAVSCTSRTGMHPPSGEKGKNGTPTRMLSETENPFKPGEVLIRFKEPLGKEALKAFLTQMNVSILYGLNAPGLYLLAIQDGVGVMDKIREMETDPRVAYAEPNYTFHLNASQEKHTYPPGEALVRFRPHTERARVDAILKALGLEMVEAFSLPQLFRVKAADPATDVETILQGLMACPEVLYAEPNYRFTLEPSKQ